MRRIIFKLTRRLRPQHCRSIRLPLGTPKDRSLFSVLDYISKERMRTLDGIDEHSLTLGVRPFRCTVTNIVSRLRTTANGEWTEKLMSARR